MSFPRHIGYVFTNYNNSSFTRKAVESISLSPDWSNSIVVIVDNNSSAEDVESLRLVQKDFPLIHLILHTENVGYFNGLNLGITYLRNSYDLDCIVIGNNDLVFPIEFSEQIRASWDRFLQHPVISPDLVDLDGVHQNPHVISEISPLREIIWDLYYTNYFFSIVIGFLARSLKRFVERKDYTEHHVARTIYQGYGACYILGPLFFRHFGLLWAPTFLMGEEFFLSKQLEAKNYSVFYEPKIVVTHLDHATMGKLPSQKLWQITRDSHKIYRSYVKRPCFLKAK